MKSEGIHSEIPGGGGRKIIIYPEDNRMIMRIIMKTQKLSYRDRGREELNSNTCTGRMIVLIVSQ